MPSTLLQLTANLKTLLLPLLVAHGGALENSTVETRSLDTAEDINNLLQKHGSRMPAGFLGLPRPTRVPRNGRMIDLDVAFGFLAGFKNQRTPEDRLSPAYDFFDDLLSLTIEQRPAHTGLPQPTNFDFIDVKDAQFADSEELGISALLASITVRIRNLQVNSLPE